MDELKPCPFCGRDTADIGWRRDVFDDTVLIAVVCSACGAKTGDFPAGGEPEEDAFWEQRAAYQAVDAWNRRA